MTYRFPSQDCFYYIQCFVVFLFNYKNCFISFLVSSLTHSSFGGVLFSLHHESVCFPQTSSRVCTYYRFVCCLFKFCCTVAKYVIQSYFESSESVKICFVSVSEMSLWVGEWNEYFFDVWVPKTSARPTWCTMLSKFRCLYLYGQSVEESRVLESSTKLELVWN